MDLFCLDRTINLCVSWILTSTEVPSKRKMRHVLNGTKSLSMASRYVAWNLSTWRTLSCIKGITPVRSHFSANSAPNASQSKVTWQNTKTGTTMSRDTSAIRQDARRASIDSQIYKITWSKSIKWSVPPQTSKAIKNR